MVAGWPPAALGDLPPSLEAMRRAVSAHYRVEFDSVHVNLYRDGRDGVAWHGDTNRKTLTDPLVVTVSLGTGGGSCSGRAVRRTDPVVPAGGGDLIVMGGACQHDGSTRCRRSPAAPAPACPSPCATPAKAGGSETTVNRVLGRSMVGAVTSVPAGRRGCAGGWSPGGRRRPGPGRGRTASRPGRPRRIRSPAPRSPALPGRARPARRARPAPASAGARRPLGEQVRRPAVRRQPGPQPGQRLAPLRPPASPPPTRVQRGQQPAVTRAWSRAAGCPGRPSGRTGSAPASSPCSGMNPQSTIDTLTSTPSPARSNAADRWLPRSASGSTSRPPGPAAPTRPEPGRRRPR